MNVNRVVTFALYIAMLVMNLVGPAAQVSPVQAQVGDQRVDAVVLVNSSSSHYSDFQSFIKPYLDHFGIPYTTLDIAVTPVTVDIGSYALIIVGHRQLDTAGTVLDSSEQGTIAAAVSDGTGLVNFDNDLSVGGISTYAYIDSVFGFGYTAPQVWADIKFSSTPHYITQNHAADSTISTGYMTLAGLVLPETATRLATAGWDNTPFLVAAGYGQGRAVQWGSYDWMSHDVKGPAYDLDDLVWRSLVWAARKPFVLQGMPPFVTLRMDDTNGPLEWIHIANEYGIIPWAGIFPNDIDSAGAADMAGLAADGKATFGMHAYSTNSFFYFNHPQETEFTDAEVAQNFSQVTQWFQANNIPISKYVVGHYYELGTNVFEELQSWGVEFVGTMMDPGQAEANAQWVQNGPFRLYETGSARDLQRPVYYADYLNIPNHPELANQFFNCVTEYRDIDNYEWHPSPDIQRSILTGEHWLTRAFNNMQVATLYTHEYDLDDINMTMWRQMIEGITQEIADYQPLYVSHDYACQYSRAVHDSSIITGTYNFAANQLVTSLGGATDMPTKFYVFSDVAGQIQQHLVDVPAFTGSIDVQFSLPGQPDHITVSPSTAAVVAGGTQQFSATGYDIENNPIPNLPVNWQVINGGGTIDRNGFFTAGAGIGTFTDTVVATYGALQASATVEVTAAVLDHFGFEPVGSPVYAGTAFAVTLRALDANGSPVIGYDGQVTLSDSTGTIQPAQVSGFSNGVWSGAVTISQAASGVTITASDGSASGTSSAFDVIQTTGASYTIWPDSALPNYLNVSDGIPIELGVKFQTSLDGYVTGLRFYKGSLNTGTHTGHLWSAAGELLATVTFTGETASGWQNMLLDVPVPVAANTTYIASYFSPTGYFSDTAEYFTSAVVSPPLRGLANGEDGPNGVYHYGSSGFPTATWVGHAPNYWADVIFATSVGPDTTPPGVTSFSPGDGATGVGIGTNVSATFSEALDSGTVNSGTFELRDAAGVPVPAVVTYDSASRTATLDPTGPLAYESVYTLVVKGGLQGVHDLAGNPLAADATATFTTASTPPLPPSEGPGGPILIISSAGNPFSRYYTEILRAEGLNAFTASDISQVGATDLLNYDVVLLGEMALAPEQVSMLADWVTAGGNLIAMRPDVQLNSLMGLASPSGTLSEGYLLVDTSSAPGQGIVNQTIQYHGSADLRPLDGSTSIATLYQDATTATTSPAVSIHSVGTNGGQAAAFAFDLARSIVYTRQGNPNWAGQERDGYLPIRANDMFYGNAAADPQPDWVNLNKVAIPQADEQQRLLANLILYMNSDRKPLPRFWYLPRGEKAAVLLTGDDHNGAGTPVRFEYYLAQSPAGCSVDDWECIRSSAYIFDDAYVSNTTLASYQSQGFEIALHVDTNCANFTPQLLAAMYDAQLSTFQGAFPGLAAPKTERTHCIVWSDWDSQIKVKLDHNIRMDLNYYFWPASWVQNRPGFFTGSGMPMRFTDVEGNILDVYQAVTQMTDESNQTYPFTIDTLLDRALGTEGYYGIFNANMHNDFESPGVTGIIDSARSHGVPVVSAAQVLKWLDGRNNSSFQNIVWNENTLSFQVAFGEGANGLQVLLPAQTAAEQLSAITLDGNPVNYTLQSIKGIEYATFLANAGTYQAQYGQHAELPVAYPDAYTLSEDEQLITPPPGVLSNDSTAGNNTLTSVLVAGPSHGSLILNLNGSFIYTPDANFYGADNFTYKAIEGSSESVPVGVSITVTPVNDPPSAAADSYTTGEDQVLSVPARGVLVNDADIDSTYLAAVLASPPSHGSLSFLSDGAFTYIPDLNWNGSDSFTYTANDGMLNSSPATVSITVAPGNDAPVCSAAALTTAEDTPGSVALSCTDIDGDPLIYSVVAQPMNGTAFIDGSTLTYAPAADFFGADSLSFAANDGALDSLAATLDLTITPVNDAPVCLPVSITIFEDTAGETTANCTDVDHSQLTYRIATAPVFGTAETIGSTLRYIPNENFYGNDSFPYLANDGELDSAAAAASVNVASVNDAPIAVNDLAFTLEDRSVSIDVVANDSDPDGNLLPSSAAVVDLPVHGTLTQQGNGSFVYEPAANYHGPDSFTYRVCDSLETCSSAMVLITVEPVNDIPVAAADIVSVLEDTPVTFEVLNNDSDIDGDWLSIISNTQPVHGTLVLDPGSVFTYTPPQNYFGSDWFTYTISDGQGATTTGTVDITIIPVNDLPTAVDDTYTTLEDTVLTIAAPGVLSNDSDPDGDGLNVSANTQPDRGALVVNPDGSFTYHPGSNYNGVDRFAYTVSDGHGGSASATVYLTVTAVNDAPLAVNDTVATDEDAVVTFSVLANDTDAEGNPLTIDSFTQPAHGVLVINANNSVTYTPDANYYGTDSFTYRASDGSLVSNIATVSIQIAPVIDLPVANADVYSTNGNQALTIPVPGVLANDSDPEGGALTAVLVQGPAHGTLTLNVNGSFTYIPVNGFAGSDSFTYQASSGTTSSSPVEVTIQVINTTTIFNDGFESGDLSAWSASVTDRGDLSVIPGAALGGTGYGMRAVIDDKNAIYVVDNSPTAETRYTARFSFDPNTMTMARGTAHLIFTAKNSAGVKVAFVELRYSGGYQVRVGLINDKTTTTTSSWYAITDAPHVFEITWAASAAPGANNGSLVMSVDSTLAANLTGVDNDTRRIEQVFLGAVEGLDNGTRGTCFFDSFASHR